MSDLFLTSHTISSRHSVPRWWHKLLQYAAPAQAYRLAGHLLPWAWLVALVATVSGLYVGFLVAPTDHQQGEAYRIIFVHVPAAWMSMLIYLVMAGWSAVGLALNARLSFMMAQAMVQARAMFIWSYPPPPSATQGILSTLSLCMM